MNNRFLIVFVVALLIIVIAVLIILGVLFGVARRSSPTATIGTAAGVTVRNDTARAVQVQDCTGALSACASSNMGTTRLDAGASGTERGATGLRILNLQGGVVGCISLAGVSNGATVTVSSAKACPA